MNYVEFKNQQQKEFNKFPIGWAFGDRQLEEVIKTIGKGNKENLIPIGCGGVIHKDNKEKYIALQNKLFKDKQKFLEDEEHLRDAINYEMGNHEYILTYDDNMIIYTLGISEEKRNSEEFQKIYKEVRDEYIRWNEENN